MTRGYVEGDYEPENNAEYLYAANLRRAIKGKRGQKLLRDLADALDAMPEKQLVPNSFTCSSGVCTFGALGQARGVDMSGLERIAERVSLNYDEADVVDDIGELNDATAAAFDVARSLAADIMWRNDLYGRSETPEARWARMRAWVASRIEKDGS